MMRNNLILCVFILLLGCNALAQQASSQTAPLQCTPAKKGDTQPWVHNSKVLDSFPSENPPPRFIGAFRDKNRSYRLELYQKAKGVFGELSSPVLDADSPTSRLYDATFDSQTGALQFSSRFRNEKLQSSCLKTQSDGWFEIKANTLRVSRQVARRETAW